MTSYQNCKDTILTTWRPVELLKQHANIHVNKDYCLTNRKKITEKDKIKNKVEHNII